MQRFCHQPQEKILADLSNFIKYQGLQGFHIDNEVRFWDQNEGWDDKVFMLQIPQTSLWRYTSPTRVWRSFTKNKSIPLSTKVFAQHPIEALCFPISLSLDAFNRLIDYEIESHLQKYDKYRRDSFETNRKSCKQLFLGEGS